MTNTPGPTDLVSVRQPGTRRGYGRMAYGTFEALYSDSLELVPADEPEEELATPAAPSMIPGTSFTPDYDASTVGAFGPVSGSTAFGHAARHFDPQRTDDVTDGDVDNGRASGGQE